MTLSCYFDLQRLERNIEFKAKSGTKFLPIAGVTAESVIDVNRAKPVSELGRKRMQDVQENYRINASRQPDSDAFAAQPQRRKQPCASARQFP